MKCFSGNKTDTNMQKKSYSHFKILSMCLMYLSLAKHSLCFEMFQPQYISPVKKFCKEK